MLIDLLIGLFAANALPHYVFGRLDSRVLGLFGYSGKANLAYAFFCSFVSLGLFHWKYGLQSITEHGILIGVFFVVVSYYAGWAVIDRYLTDRASHSGDSTE